MIESIKQNEMSEWRKKTYLPKDKRKTILLISDDARHFSGVANMSREIIFNTCQHLNWVQIGCQGTHPEPNKVVDLNSDITNLTHIPDPYVRIYTANAEKGQFGNMALFEQITMMESIDALMLFTDPRFFVWVFENEYNIRTRYPIIYYNIWDNIPYPKYNKLYYKSCDALFPISKQTMNINMNLLDTETYEVR